VLGSAPDRVRVVVITKDVWSLRLSWGLVGTLGGLDRLTVQPEETNLLGSQQSIFGNFVLEPSATTLGLGYIIPRLGASRVAVLASANVVLNRASGSPEGSSGGLVAGEPLFSGLTPWAWDARTQWSDVITRHYVNGSLDTYVDRATGDRVPYEYHSRQYQTNFELRRTFGWETKHEITISARVADDVYRVGSAGSPGVDPRALADFDAAAVPVSDTSVGPSIQYETYTKRYVRVIDFETLALQEDYRLGQDILLRAAPSFRALGGSRDVLDLVAAAQYTFALRDGLFRAAVVSVTDPEPGRISDASVQPALHLVTPTVAGIGRIVADGTLLYRWRNYLNEVTFLGGESRLRGFPTSFFGGSNFVAYTLELRSRPVEVLTFQAALVAFFDAGDAFTGMGDFHPVQSVGIGLRALVPWLDRVVFRADLGFQLERPIDTSTGAPIPPLALLVTLGQAFGVPTVAPVPVLPTEQYESQDTTAGSPGNPSQQTIIAP
ncbi:MAG: hypothetical protein ACREJ3_11215, partial [Polyangiaceae bacterium]